MEVVKYVEVEVEVEDVVVVVDVVEEIEVAVEVEEIGEVAKVVEEEVVEDVEVQSICRAFWNLSSMRPIT